MSSGLQFKIVVCDWLSRRRTGIVSFIWWQDLHLYMKFVFITTKAASSNPDHDEVYSIQYYVIKFVSDLWSLMVMIVWQLDLQLLMQSVSITTEVLSWNPAHDEVYWIKNYVIKFVSDLQQVCGFLRVLWFAPPIKLYCHNIAEILLKVVLSTRTLKLQVLIPIMTRCTRYNIM